jgi:hypothetical protein
MPFMQNSGFILAIEFFSDDTAAAILQNKVLSNVVANQLIHNQYGGVVPELASRAHQQNIVPVIDAALRKANIQKNSYQQLPSLKVLGSWVHCWWEVHLQNLLHWL